MSALQDFAYDGDRDMTAQALIEFVRQALRRLEASNSQQFPQFLDALASELVARAPGIHQHEMRDTSEKVPWTVRRTTVPTS